MTKDDYKLDPPQPVTAGDGSPHPGPLIRDELAAAGYSISRVAQIFGMNRANLNNMILTKASLSRDVAYRVSALLNPDDTDFTLAKFLIEMQARHDWAKDAETRQLIRTLVKQGLEREARAAA